MQGLAAIIPAAGLSSRMGRFKPLLPLDGGTVLSRCVRLFTACGVERIVVVTGKRADEVAACAMEAGAMAVHNPAFEQGMYTSVLTGVRALKGDAEGLFMLPADIPLVRPETVRRLLDEFQRTRPAVLYPRFNGERGHPPVIGGEVVPAILAHDGQGGLRAVLDGFEPDARDLDVADFGTTHDLDHPEDYELALAVAGIGYPLEDECAALIRMQGVSDHIVGHCRAVAAVAQALCARLNDRLDERPGAVRLDPGLVLGAALTHDIGKGTKRHEAAGAELLREHGFSAAADIVAAHFDVTLADGASISEKEVVFLADKLVRCHGPVPLRGRYLEKVEMYKHEEGAEAAILGRMGRAEAVMARFDREMDGSAESVAREALA
ncbi:Molybdenum cofactor cytidylyltransferase [Pseudodesulfovibrio hydrargyri]|uniref:Molybdenum cofactor cytidylyltransferase n=1 Tax=Pseudodesulfovibrio hydrargyri TaxID=2125990 RepID=A0A1J5N765_9BACT|nr:NTP transferase domain-containing protein [Pseudodesulfovibrio hydrargyri]OIQ51467.1 Molybdenum cofactor cytidylyltransferase [Pseudodesulfovibrio hydrargyri]